MYMYCFHPATVFYREKNLEYTKEKVVSFYVISITQLHQHTRKHSSALEVAHNETGDDIMLS